MHLTSFVLRSPSLFIVFAMFVLAVQGQGQPQLAPEERVIFLTKEWEGERDRYGRPLVPDRILERMRHVSLEEAWSILRELGYHSQLEAGWEILHPQQVMVGRALTTAFLPRRTELDERMTALGREEGFGGGTNQWPMSLLVEGDVIVADHYGKLREAAFIGDNLAQAIYSASNNGAVIYGQARDITGVREIEGFNTWVKAWHPSSSADRMLISINDIIRVGEAVVLPGDVVLATEGGVLFIPPHLAERVIRASEVIRLEDAFRIEGMAAGRFRSQEVYAQRWSSRIEDEFYRWLAEDRRRLQQTYNVDGTVIDGLIERRDRNWRNWLQ